MRPGSRLSATALSAAAVLVLTAAAHRRDDHRLVQGANCRFEVVHCNYGALYSGTVSWSKTLNYRVANRDWTASSLRTETVTATITKGRAVCAGNLDENRQSTEGGGSRGKLRATISGPGLFAVEFDKDERGALYYLVTVACASEAGTDTTTSLKTGEAEGMTIDATPPKLDGREMQSDKQPASAIAIPITGSITFTHPDEDRANGVTGTVTVKWDLKRG